MYKFFFKKAIDLSISIIGLLLVSPLFILIMILLTISNKGTPFFMQARSGKCGKIFRVFKFKTMNDSKDKDGNLLSDEKRITSIGRLIRRTSLDEFPQVLNVIKGDMSLVGPRPLLEEYLALYSQEQNRRHEIKPGITGWAQVNGRNNISWQEKLSLDIWYVDNVSFALDMKILFMTLVNAIGGRDISKDGYVTTEKFNGKN